ncbi:MAG: twin-arginine translocase subunit TatC [Deltaproteobacteria bacterium]|jgi:sec-independent protein translocase protein TatC|nr:twin-arginine translocase subunit TatC [Deltaproteobacteria bacterium]
MTDYQKELPVEGGKESSFFEHLAELRNRIIKSLLSIVPGFFVAYAASEWILKFLTHPLLEAMPPNQGLIATALPETFLIHLKISLWGGLFISAPFWMYQLWAFVAPGLYSSEKKATLKLTGMAFGLLVLGAGFAYQVVLPIGFKFFISFSGAEITILPTINEYLSLITTLLLSFGVAFEMPLFLMFLASIGLVNSQKLSRFRQYAILIIVIVAAFLTPPDVISQILMSIPMLGLYELSLFLIRQKEKEKEKALLEAETNENPSPPTEPPAKS